VVPRRSGRLDPGFRSDGSPDAPRCAESPLPDAQDHLRGHRARLLAAAIAEHGRRPEESRGERGHGERDAVARGAAAAAWRAWRTRIATAEAILADPEARLVAEVGLELELLVASHKLYQCAM